MSILPSNADRWSSDLRSAFFYGQLSSSSCQPSAILQKELYGGVRSCCRVAAPEPKNEKVVLRRFFRQILIHP